MSVSLSVCLSVYLSICLSVCLSVCPSVRLSVHLSVCLSICLSVCLSVCLSIHLSVCPLCVCLCPSLYLSSYKSLPAAPADYIGRSDEELVLTPDESRVCVSVIVFLDDVVENSEVFLAVIESDDPVMLTINGASITIADSTSKFEESYYYLYLQIM